MTKMKLKTLIGPLLCPQLALLILMASLCLATLLETLSRPETKWEVVSNGSAFAIRNGKVASWWTYPTCEAARDAIAKIDEPLPAGLKLTEKTPEDWTNQSLILRTFTQVVEDCPPVRVHGAVTNQFRVLWYSKEFSPATNQDLTGPN